jgi:ergothioneine biosynthesis protein EgtB
MTDRGFWYAMLERSETLTARFAAGLAEAFAAVRAHSVALAAPLSDEDCMAQSMPDASPVKWHLAHTTWFFETFVLERFEPDFAPFHPAFRVLYNSYYNGIGEKHPRPERGLVTRPSRREVLDYRADVDARVMNLLNGCRAAAEVEQAAALIELGLHHEQQHQELIVTDVLHLLSRNPLFPEYDRDFPAPGRAGELQWRDYPAGIVEIGHAGPEFCFDNELPRHRQFVESYGLASRLVTNAEYAAFIDAGGYNEPSFWLSEGWAWVQARGRRHPLYWQPGESGWREFSAHGLREMDLSAPILHVSYFEAAAYAQFAGARLPTEAEWENAAADPELAQMFGTAWQWTSSSYAPYPGFVTAAGAIGEYNGKFMVNQYVLRGASLATPTGHSRATYRNFFPADACWQFTGIRLAR